MHHSFVSQPYSVARASNGENTSCIWHAEPQCFPVQGIDLEAGGRNKKTWRTAPKSENVYLKLLVKVRAAAPLRVLWQNTSPQPEASPCWLSQVVISNAELVKQIAEVCSSVGCSSTASW